MAASISSTPSLAITYTLADGTTTETSTAGVSLAFGHGTGTGQANIGVASTGYISSGETVIYDFQKFSKGIWNSQLLLDFTSTCGNYLDLTPNNPERGIKGLIITNSWDAAVLPTGDASISSWTGIVTPDGTGLPDSALPSINIRTTGLGTASITGTSGSFQQLFSNVPTYLHVATGNISIKPQSTWSFVDPVGKTPLYSTGTSVYMHTLQIVTENFTNISGSGGLSSGASGDVVYYPIWNDVSSGSPWSGNLPRMSYEILAIGVTG